MGNFFPTLLFIFFLTGFTAGITFNPIDAFADNYYILTMPPLCLLFVRAVLQLGVDRLSWVRQAVLALAVALLPIGQTVGEYRRWHREHQKFGGHDE